MTYKHYIITRFNLRKSEWTIGKNKNPVLTDLWHDNRFELFKNFCFPSVANQTNQNFEWLIFFDNNTKPKYRKIIEDLQTQFSGFSPIFIDGMDAFLPSVQHIINRCNQPYLITSRLDNDDCLSRHYIEIVQKQFKKQDFLALDFVNGYTLQTGKQFKIGKELHVFNPFISLIEKNDNPVTVWSRSHASWKHEPLIKNIKNKPIWLSVIHEENKVNKFKGYGNLDIQKLLQDFAIKTDKKANISKNLMPCNYWFVENKINYVSSYFNYYFKILKSNFRFFIKIFL